MCKVFWFSFENCNVEFTDAIDCYAQSIVFSARQNIYMGIVHFSFYVFFNYENL